jgi:chaperonin cofactor prefoldin
MIFPYITLAVALTIAGVAAYFSILGLAALFAAAAIPIIIMGTALEVGKLASAVWLHRNWYSAPRLLKYYLTAAVVVLMLITSMGIFGFLSKGHLEQQAPIASTSIQIERTENRIQSLERQIQAEETRLEQLDSIIDTLVEYDKISGPDGARAVRQRQEEEREQINASIDSAYEKIDELQDKLTNLRSEVSSSEVKLGPVKYVSEMLFEDAENNRDTAVRWLILMIIFAFDPLAVLLLLAANHSLLQQGKSIPAITTNQQIGTHEPDIDTEDEKPQHKKHGTKISTRSSKGDSPLNL